MSKFITEENATFQLKNWENKFFPQAMVEDEGKEDAYFLVYTLRYLWDFSAFANTAYSC